MPEPSPVPYRSPDEDSARWLAVERRPGDIVVSTRSKSGTTWMQMICALLVFQTPTLPEPLGALSPWIDSLQIPLDELCAQLDAQRHRRVLKTHTPLDGMPVDPDVTFIVVARHPLDMAVSLYHQGDNLDRARMRELVGDPKRAPTAPPQPRPSLHDWLVGWIDWIDWIDEDADWRSHLDSLPGIAGHVGDAWARRHEPNVLLVHYEDLSRNRDTEMRRVAAALDITIDDDLWPALVRAAGFDEMRARADVLAPDATRVLKDRTAFFRRGRSGAGAEVLTPDELARYHDRVSRLAPPDLLAWLHHGAAGRDEGDGPPPVRDRGRAGSPDPG